MKIGIVGASGEVGRMMLLSLEEFNIPVSELRLFASIRSAGQRISYKDRLLLIDNLTEKAMKEKYDYLLFSVGSSVSYRFAPIAAEHGNTVIDNSSAFRRDSAIPLIVPEINGDLIRDYRGIIANPNCSTIQMVLPLAALDREFRLKKVIVSTYQSVSGSGHKGIAELESQEKGSKVNKVYPREIHRNVIPQIADFRSDGYTEEEEKMRFETNKILGRTDILISATTVRVPVCYGHSESVYAEFENEIDFQKAEECLRAMKSVVYLDKEYITPLELKQANNSYVSRLRYGVDRHSLTFWNVGDNVRLGAAVNAVRILVKMMEKANS
ncbi:MAG: aspartate-semialdehyde dehydrogenase [Candidatus Cloacimonetes bacterium]|nr:aspartate-semialdehyde dehydrogenase [Candidatus Cloacimonadota bacterium]